VVTTDVLAMADSAAVLDELYLATGGAVGGALTQQAVGLLAAPVVEQTLGRRADATVRTPAGVVVVAAGQIVTETVIARARQHHQEQALVEATGLKVETAYRQGASQGLQRANLSLRQGSAIASQQLKTGASQLQVEAITLWAALQREVAKFQVQVQQFIENRRIQHALGRPVTRVILDDQDQVILNVGELVTHRAIARARQANSLEMVLGSVYTHSPELITRSDLRAPARAEVALVRQG
jgi:regulator of extracellular matrix RemA (YlzA/DUF370 family)